MKYRLTCNGKDMQYVTADIQLAENMCYDFYMQDLRGISSGTMPIYSYCEIEGETNEAAE